MYKIVADMMNASTVYIYEETEHGTRYKMSVHYDIDLARRIVEYLNKEEQENSV